MKVEEMVAGWAGLKADWKAEESAVESAAKMAVHLGETSDAEKDE